MKQGSFSEQSGNCMKYSLINVEVDKGETVDGYWVQNVIGSLKDAAKIARETEKANGYRIKIAIVNEINSTTPLLEYWRGLKRIA